MTIECHKSNCKYHCTNSGDLRDDGPFCCEKECHYTPLMPSDCTADELDKDNSFNQWLYEGAWK